MGGTLQTARLNRSTEKELDEGIAELERRGYELIKRESQEEEKKDFHYKEKLGQNYKFGGWDVRRKHVAVMRRIYYG